VSKLLEAILLGLVQGLTEFLPVSSSGHLAIFQHLLGWNDPEGNLAFNVAVHLGSLLAVLVFVRSELIGMVTRTPRLILVVAVATLPIALCGPFLKDAVEGVSASLLFTGLCLLLTAALLGAVRRHPGGSHAMERVPLARALFVGVAQVLAVLPGVSRSGTTLAASLGAGFEREQALRFAFLLAAPAIAGAGLMMVLKGHWEGSAPAGALLAGTVVSFFTSLLAMKLMVGVVARRKLGWFALYCAVVGLVSIGAHFLAR